MCESHLKLVVEHRGLDSDLADLVEKRRRVTQFLGGTFRGLKSAASSLRL